MRKTKRELILLQAAALTSVSLLLAGCSNESGDQQLQEAAAAINTAIEHDLAMDRYEFTIARSTALNDTIYERQTTTYLSVLEDGRRDYYITTTPNDESSTLVIEHMLLGDEHYHRIFDTEKQEYHIPSGAKEATAARPDLFERSWTFESAGPVSDDYRKRLWIYEYRISPEDFAKASIEKSGKTTTITLTRSPEQLKENPLPTKVMLQQAKDQYEAELAKDNLKPQEKASLEAAFEEAETAKAGAEGGPYTAETLKAVIDSSGRLLTISYSLTQQQAEGMEVEGEAIQAITQYSDISLERSDDDSIVLPD